MNGVKLQRSERRVSNSGNPKRQNTVETAHGNAVRQVWSSLLLFSDCAKTSQDYVFRMYQNLFSELTGVRVHENLFSKRTRECFQNV